jgi:hypothetical protein
MVNKNALSGHFTHSLREVAAAAGRLMETDIQNEQRLSGFPVKLRSVK